MQKTPHGVEADDREQFDSFISGLLGTATKRGTSRDSRNGDRATEDEIWEDAGELLLSRGMDEKHMIQGRGRFADPRNGRVQFGHGDAMHVAAGRDNRQRQYANGLNPSALMGPIEGDACGVCNDEEDCPVRCSPFFSTVILSAHTNAQ